jgi:hypothetical protein
MTVNIPLSMASTVVRSGSCLAAKVSDELILMDAEQGNYFGLDPICAAIWERLEGPVTLSDLCAALGREYDADAETIARDVMRLMERMIEACLVQVTA